MKITEFTTTALDVPVHAAASAKGGACRSLPMLFVRLATDDGLAGWGEAFAFNLRDATRTALEGLLRPRMLGCDPTDFADRMLRIRREFRNSKNGPLSFALSAVDIAMWDIVGKAAGLPLCRLFGGARMSLPAYASLERFGDPGLAARGAEAAVGAGYRRVKLHEIACEPVAAVRDAIGDAISLMVDVSSGWDVPAAIRAARRLSNLDLVWLEEPTWPPEDYRALARVAGEGGVPLAAGENVLGLTDFRVLCESGAVDFAQPSVAKIGGVTEVRKAIAVADAFGVSAMPHSYYLGPGLLASLHVIAAIPDETLVEHAVFDLEADPYGGAIALVDGRLPVPEGPGLGFDPDPDFLTRYEIG